MVVFVFNHKGRKTLFPAFMVVLFLFFALIIAVFGQRFAQMQGAEKFVTGATWKVVRTANFPATPQMGEYLFKH